jgi:hypothetical protein
MKKLTLIFIAFVISTFIHAQCDHDTTNPWFDNLVTNITVECNDDLSFLIPDAFDDCDTLVDIAWYEEITPNNWCPNSFTIFRVYRAYDDFGNQVVESQTVYVVDETPPTFLYTPPNINEGCYQNFVLEEPIIEDNCSNYVLVDTFTVVSDDPCNYIAYRTLTAVDECGNSETKIQSISLIDTIPPAIVGEQYIEVNPNQNLDTIFITVSDNCNEPYVYYTDLETSYTRIIEHKYFDNQNQKTTWVSMEFPQEYTRGVEPFYPVNDENNNTKYKKYKELADNDKVIFGGRLAEYKYYDMHQVVASALKKINEL